MQAPLQRFFAIFSILLLALPVFAGASHSWLLSQQNADGSFSNTADIALNSQATGEAITALLIDKVVSPSQLTTAKDFLAASDISHTEALARQIIAVVNISGAANPTLINQLTSFQNENGGFGSYKGYESDPLSTAWALRALSAAKINNALSFDATTYLVAAASTDGGWQLDGFSSVTLTAEVMLALNAYKNNPGVVLALSNARSYVWSLKQLDNLWGDSFESALAISALSLSAPVQADLLPSIESLNTRGLANSSWDNDVYTTALVLQAFKRVISLSSDSIGKGGISGQLFVSGSNTPVANAQVFVDGVLSSIKTDANGKFSLAALNEGLATLVFQKAGFQSLSKAIQVGANVNSDVGAVYIAQSAGTTLLGGRAYDSATGLAVSGAVLTLTGVSSQIIVANSQGVFETSALQAGSYSFDISAPGYYTASGSFLLGLGSNMLVNQSMVPSSIPQVSDPVAVSGVVIDGLTKNAVPFAVVTLDSTTILADINGQFLVPQVSRGTHQIQISAAGFNNSDVTFNLAPGASGNLGQLSIYSHVITGGNQAISLLAKCVDGVSGAPIFGATVSVKDSTIVGVTDSQGVVSLNGILKLSFEVTIQAQGYLSRSYSVDAYGFGSVATNFTLTPIASNAEAFSISGIVKDSETKAPVDGVTLSVANVASVVSGADGSYKIEGVKDMPFVLNVNKDGYAPYQLKVDVSETAANYILDPILTKKSSATLFSVENIDIPASVEPDQRIEIKTTIKNLAAEARDVLVIAHIRDLNGQEIETLLPYHSLTQSNISVINFSANETVLLTLPWNVLQAAAGIYSVTIDVVEQGTTTQDLPRGQVLASRAMSTSVIGVSKFGGAIETTPPLLQLGEKTPVKINAVLRNTGNQLLPAGDYSLRIYKDSQNSTLYQKSISIDALKINEITSVDFGEWTPDESTSGGHHVLITRTDLVNGSVNAEIYIGDVAKATFTLDKAILPIGDSVVKANVHLSGVDTTEAKSADPLLAVVKTAVEKGAVYTAQHARTWNDKEKCLGCHIQSQGLAALGSALGKADVSERDAKYLLNSLTTGLRPEGTINTHFNNYGPQSSALMANWALTEWQKPEDYINTLLQGLAYVWSFRQAQSNSLHWGGDIGVGWLYNDFSSTALATIAASRAKNIVDNVSEIPGNYSFEEEIYVWGNWGDNAITISDNYIYMVKPNGWIQRLNTSTKESTTLVSYLAEAGGVGVNGIAIDANKNILLSTQRGNVVRLNSSAQVLKNIQVCIGNASGVAIGDQGNIYVACYEQGKIFKISPSDVVSELIDVNSKPSVYGIAWHPDGYLVVTNHWARQVLKVTTNGELSVLAEGFSQRPLDITVLPSGEIAVTGIKANGANYGVELIQTNGIARRVAFDPQIYSTNGLYSIGITSAPDGTIYTSSWSGEKLWKYKPAPQSPAVVNNYIEQMPLIAAYYLQTFDLTDKDNLNQASRIIGLAEAKKHISDTALLSQVDTTINQLADLLRKRQAEEGGWARLGVANAEANDKNYHPDPLITAYVGIAMEYTEPSNQDPMVRGAITYLLNAQQAGGNWHSTTGLFPSEDVIPSVDNPTPQQYLATTSMVMIYLPKAIERLGGLDVKVVLDVPANVTLVNPDVAPASVTNQADGATRYLWDIKGVTGTGRDIKFDLGIHDLDLGETRAVAQLATLSFNNSFTQKSIVTPIDIPKVTALNKLSLATTTDKPSYSANEAVMISALTKNLGENFGGGRIDLSIRPAGYTSPVASLGSMTVGTILSQQSTTLGSSWNTATNLAGNYEVFGQLFDTKGRLVAEGAAAFVVKPSTGNNPELAAQVFNDKLSYTTSESAVIDARAINTTTNVDHSATLGKLTVKRASDNQEVFARSYAIPELAIGAFSGYSAKLGLDAVGAGDYQVSWEIFTANGQTLITRASSTFTVVADLRASIKGSVTVGKQTLDVGESQACEFTTTNTGSVQIGNITVNQLVLSVESEQVVETSSRGLTLAAQASDVKSQSISTAGYAKGNYACVLQAVLNGQTYNLAQAMFAVKSADAKLDAVINNPVKARLLVLIDPPKGLVANPLHAYLTGLLDASGWYYTIVNNADDFSAELQRGGYSEYVLLSPKVTLSSQTRDLLKTKVAAGDGLVVSDGYDRRHQSLEAALGVRVRAKQTYSTGVKLNQSVLGLPWSYNFADGLNSLTFDLNGATLDGEYLLEPNGKNAPHPLGVAADFNAFTFDGFASLSSAVEGRLAVGGKLNINNFGIGNKLDSRKLNDVVVVGGDAVFPSGKVYYGNLLAGGSVSGVGAAVVNGMAANAVVSGNVNPLPVDFEAEREYLKELSANIATLPSTGTFTYQYGIYTVKGDCTSKVQVFNIQAAQLATANTLKASCIPTGATAIFNILGDTATLSNIGMQDLTNLREKVLFNVPTATKFVMSSVGIQGSVLAPYAEFYNPAGSIDGRLIAKSWNSTNYGWVGINNGVFNGDLFAAVAKGTKNAVAHFQYQNGKTAFIGFDVANQAMLLSQQNAAVNNFATLLLAALDYANPQVINPTAGRAMLYTLDVKNLVTTPVTTKVLLNITPSNGATYTALLLEGFTPTTNTNEWSASLNLGANATLTKKLYLKLPPVAAQSLSIRVRLQTGDGANAATRVDKSLPVTVLP